MHSKSDIIEIKINDQAYEVIDKSFASLFNRYQIGLETSMTGNKFVFDFVYLPYYKYHKINSKVMNHIDFPDWIKNKKSILISNQ